MLQNTSKTLGFQNIMVYNLPEGGGGGGGGGKAISGLWPILVFSKLGPLNVPFLVNRCLSWFKGHRNLLPYFFGYKTEFFPYKTIQKF